MYFSNFNYMTIKKNGFLLQAAKRISSGLMCLENPKQVIILFLIQTWLRFVPLGDILEDIWFWKNNKSNNIKGLCYQLIVFFFFFSPSPNGWRGLLVNFANVGRCRMCQSCTCRFTWLCFHKLHAAPYMVNAVKTDGPRDSWSLWRKMKITKQQQKKKKRKNQISKYIRVVLIFHWVKECSRYFSA